MEMFDIINSLLKIIIIMSIELLLLAVNLNFATFSIYLDDMVGQIFVLVRFEMGYLHQ